MGMITEEILSSEAEAVLDDGMQKEQQAEAPQEAKAAEPAPGSEA